jgi:hypothetical protein
MRPSSLLRNTRLNALIEALSFRELGSKGAAALLQCSVSSARNYLEELMDARVIAISSKPWTGGGLDRTVYCLNPDPLIVGAFQTALGEFASGADKAANAAVRDPLVLALFGAPQALMCQHLDAR